ncbi:hypothetical protein HII31_07145 [Pseudocercospora fuligena]|uniref:Uncharacterized protein n=1 Tax=Pseudocercospora fuligena TaxID=685502 RepID=A0A8H6RID5_9PEZI|nr:hypothetical protein HII31_07145 [Pseudocercospora fuligena]
MRRKKYWKMHTTEADSMPPKPTKEPRKASTLAQERIQQQYAAYPGDEEENDEEHDIISEEESEDEYIQSDEDGDKTYMPSPRRVRTRTRNSKDDSDEPSPKRIRTQCGKPKDDDDSEDKALFDEVAYHQAIAQSSTYSGKGKGKAKEEEECPSWHPSMPQPDGDDEEFKPILDQNGEIVDSIEPTPLQRMSVSPAPTENSKRKRSLATIRLEKAVAKTERDLAKLELDEHLAMIDEDEEMTG